MPRSDATTGLSAPTVQTDDADLILARALGRLTRVSEMYGLSIKALCTNAGERTIDIQVPTEAVLRRWAAVLGVAATVNRVEHHDIGIIEHSFTASVVSFYGWTARFRHNHTIPTIPGDPTA